MNCDKCGRELDLAILRVVPPGDEYNYLCKWCYKVFLFEKTGNDTCITN